MEGTFKPPKSLNFDKNVHLNLENFLRSLNIYLKATGLCEKDGETKVAILLNHAGEEAQTKFQTFGLSDEDKKDFEKVVDAFKNYCKPLRNETYDRYKFFTRTQQEGEDFDHFHTDVKMLAASCNFGNLESSLIRDKIVSGIRDLGIQERLLQYVDLTEKRAEAICRAAEVSKYQVKELRNDKEVDVVRQKGKIQEVGYKSGSQQAEDAVCLADYCDIMRCEVLITQDFKTVFPEHENTDIEIWREASSYTKALATPGPKDVAKYTFKNGNYAHNVQKTTKNIKTKKHCQKTDTPQDASINDKSSSEGDKSQNSSNEICQNDLVDSALPAPDNKQQRIIELQKLKANCKPEELQKIKTKCEILVRDCIASLLIQLSVKDFKEIEDELNRAVCWYLTCDRYWEDSQTDIRSFPWGLLCMIIMVMSLGICVCYYIIWVLFDVSIFSMDDISVTSASLTDRSTPSPSHILRQEASTSGESHHVYSEDYLGAEKDNEYIYVTYPPDLKRRLLESCYNRTTRL